MRMSTQTDDHNNRINPLVFKLKNYQSVKPSRVSKNARSKKLKLQGKDLSNNAELLITSDEMYTYPATIEITLHYQGKQFDLKLSKNEDLFPPEYVEIGYIYMRCYEGLSLQYMYMHIIPTNHIM